MGLWFNVASAMSALHEIHPLFAERIADRYIAIYNSEGFKESKRYLDDMTGNDQALRNVIVPIIMEKGNNGKK
jgi:hypothetical protein